MDAWAFAPAKVNLFLHVGAPAPDGYHPVRSLMVFADVGDRVGLRRTEDQGLEVRGPYASALAGEGQNLVTRAVEALAAHRGGPLPPVRIILDKQLPVAAGLGGGSSDAGAVLRLLRRVLHLPVSDAALEAVAASLGADGAACLWGRPVLAEGRGERLAPPPLLPDLHAVLVNPGLIASTGAVYGRFDDLGLFLDPGDLQVPAGFGHVRELAVWLAQTENGLEPAAIALHAGIGDVLEVLRQAPQTLFARMSGSGATCFALCDGEGEARRLSDRLQANRPGWWVRPCRLGGPWSPP